MKFTLVKDVTKDTLLRPLLSGLLLFILLFLTANIFLKAQQIGLTQETISHTLFGDEENFIAPITNTFLLELIHNDIFFMMMTLLTLSAVYSRLCNKVKVRFVAINLVMISALFSLLFLILAFYFSANFILPYIVAFFLWHTMAYFMALASLLHLYTPKLSH